MIGVSCEFPFLFLLFLNYIQGECKQLSFNLLLMQIKALSHIPIKLGMYDRQESRVILLLNIGLPDVCLRFHETFLDFKALFYERIKCLLGIS